MIHRTASPWQTPEWQNVLRDAFTETDELFDYLELDRRQLPMAAAGFGLKVPRGFAAQIEKGNPQDPILRQILPIEDELTPQPGFNRDPVGDQFTEVVPGVLHKYHGRILLLVGGAAVSTAATAFVATIPTTTLTPTTTSGDTPWGICKIIMKSAK